MPGRRSKRKKHETPFRVKISSIVDLFGKRHEKHITIDLSPGERITIERSTSKTNLAVSHGDTIHNLPSIPIPDSVRGLEIIHKNGKPILISKGSNVVEGKPLITKEEHELKPGKEHEVRLGGMLEMYPKIKILVEKVKKKRKK